MTKRYTVRSALVIALFAPLIGSAALARADAGPSAPLSCDNGVVYTVAGFGKGIVLHDVNSTNNFIVTFAETSDGTVVRDVKGQQGKSTLTCTATSPITGKTYTFQGFFTPKGQPNDQTY